MKTYTTKYGPISASRLSISQRRAMDAVEVRKVDDKATIALVEAVEAMAKAANPQPVKSKLKSKGQANGYSKL